MTIVTIVTFITFMMDILLVVLAMLAMLVIHPRYERPVDVSAHDNLPAHRAQFLLEHS